MGKQAVTSHTGIGRGGGAQKAMGLNAAILAALGGVFAALDPAWFQIKGHEGGEMKPNDQTEPVENEDGEVIKEIILSRREQISETTSNTSDEALDLMDTMVRLGLKFPVRVPLPVEQTGPNGEPLHQLWYFPVCRFIRDASGIPMGKGVRKKKYTLEAELTSAMRADGYTEPYHRATVDLADEANWPAKLDGAKDAAFQAGA